MNIICNLNLIYFFSRGTFNIFFFFSIAKKQILNLIVYNPQLFSLYIYKIPLKQLLFSIFAHLLLTEIILIICTRIII